MKTTPQLIRNIAGQLEGIDRMIEKNEDCFKIIIQMRAARSALGHAMEKFVQDNFIECSNVKRNRKEKDRMEKLIKELIKN